MIELPTPSVTFPGCGPDNLLPLIMPLHSTTPVTLASAITSIAHYPTLQCPSFLLRCLGRELKQMQVSKSCPVGKLAASSTTRCGGGIVIVTSRHTGTDYGIGITLTGNHLGRGRGRTSSTLKTANLLL